MQNEKLKSSEITGHTTEISESFWLCKDTFHPFEMFSLLVDVSNKHS